MNFFLVVRMKTLHDKIFKHVGSMYGVAFFMLPARLLSPAKMGNGGEGGDLNVQPLFLTVGMLQSI